MHSGELSNIYLKYTIKKVARTAGDFFDVENIDVTFSFCVGCSFCRYFGCCVF